MTTVTAAITAATAATSRTLPPRRRAHSSPRKPSASSAGSLTADEATIRAVPPEQMPVQQRRPGAQPDLQPDQQQPDHQRLVVDAADQVEQHQRVGRAEPQRQPGVQRAALGQPGQRPDDHGDPAERQRAVLQHAEHHVVAADRGDAAAEDQEQRAVRGRGVPPDASGCCGSAGRRRPAPRPGRARTGPGAGPGSRSARGSCRRRGRTSAGPPPAAAPTGSRCGPAAARVGAGATAPR